jgi:hypothetical protein
MSRIQLATVKSRRQITKSLLRVLGFCFITTAATSSWAQFQSPQERAHYMYKRLTGTGAAADNPIIAQMAAEIAAGRAKAAAALVTQNASQFYDVVVRDLFAQLSARDELVTTPLNDFIATGVGVVRDDLDARELLTGNYYYRAADGTPNVDQRVLEAIVNSNTHYAGANETGGIAPQRLSLKAVLVKQTPQVFNNNNAVAPLPDTAGLLTTRGFMSEHASAGTNRRIVEFTFREFLCIPITQWADSSSPDQMVGRDVDRFPGGVNQTYQTSCKGCHSGMDSLRVAFGRFNYTDRLQYTPANIQGKLNQNNNVYPQGFVTANTVFMNNSNRGVNAEFFGWDPSTLVGNGARDFGIMISKSRAFPKCMAKRVFKQVCRRDIMAAETALLESLDTSFRSSGYKMKDLFETVAARPECMGQ